MNSSAQILQEHFLNLRERRPSYSISALARDLGISQTMVSLVLNGKKKLSLKRAQSFSHCLGLSPGASSELLRVVALENVKDPVEREYLESLLQEAKASPKRESLTRDQEQILERWYHLALLDLVTTSDFQSDPNWIARRLGISVLEVKSAVDRLQRLGLLSCDEEGWKKKKLHFSIPTNKSRLSVRRFHKGMLRKATKALEDASQSAFEKRDITGTTIAIDPAKLAEAKERIRIFREEMATFMSEGEPKEVYQLNVQLFPLTQPIGEKKCERS